MSVTITAKEYRRLVIIPRRIRRETEKPTIPLAGDPVSCGALSLATVPPSVNNIFVNTDKGRTKSHEYRKWIKRSHKDLQVHGPWHVPGSVKVRLIVCKNQTRADLDNLIKPTIDLLVSAGRISDDRNLWRVEAEFSHKVVGVRIEIARAS